jgi:adhesin/invasin
MTSDRTAGTAIANQTITVVPPGPVTHFNVKVSPRPVAHGAPLTVKVYALDASDLVVKGYTGPISLSDLSGNLSVTSPASWSGGVGTATVTIGAPFHNDRVTATDTSGLSGPPSGTSRTFDVT